MMISVNEEGKKSESQRVSYVSPAIVYEGTISARAGTIRDSGDPTGTKFDSGVDPSDLFGNN